MDMNIVVGAVIALIVIADVVYLVRKKMRGGSCTCDCGRSSCGCGCGAAETGPNVRLDEDIKR